MILCLCFFPTAFAALPLAAFVGAFATTLFIVTVAGRVRAPRITLLLAGIACNALLNAGISFLSLLYPTCCSLTVIFRWAAFPAWRWRNWPCPAVLIAGCLLAALAAAGKANLLCLGDSMAASLGVR